MLTIQKISAITSPLVQFEGKTMCPEKRLLLTQRRSRINLLYSGTALPFSTCSN
jgi:hypothetical protein